MVRPECVHCPYNINSRNENGTGCGENVCLLEEIISENEQFYDGKASKENEVEQKKTKTQTKVEEKAPESVEKGVESVEKLEEIKEKLELSLEEVEKLNEKAKKYDEIMALKRIDKEKVIELVSNLRKECYSNFTISRTQMLTLIDNLLARLRNF